MKEQNSKEGANLTWFSPTQRIVWKLDFRTVKTKVTSNKGNYSKREPVNQVT